MIEIIGERLSRAALVGTFFAIVGPMIGWIGFCLFAFLFGTSENGGHSLGLRLDFIPFMIILGAIAYPIILKIAFLPALITGSVSGSFTRVNQPWLFVGVSCLLGGISSALLPTASLNNAQHPILRGLVSKDGPEYLAGIGAFSALSCALFLVGMRRSSLNPWR